MNFKTILQVSAAFFMTANLSAQLDPTNMEGLNQNVAATGAGGGSCQNW